jgi:metallophosphoesterase (TIGR00282 family)
VDSLHVMAIGDVVGRPGRRAVQELLPGLREKYAPCVVVANGENAAGGSGITFATAQALFEAGVDVITTGDHYFDDKKVVELAENEPRILRPANWSRGAPGRGWGRYELPGGIVLGAVNLMGRTFMGVPAGNFFDEVDDILEAMPEDVTLTVVDFHAEATSEKVAFGRYLDGKVAVCVGTHTHVQTADECVLPHGTAYITDLGMTGPHDSVLGREYDAVLKRLRTAVPARFDVAKKDVRLNGVVVGVDAATGRATSIERLSIALE